MNFKNIILAFLCLYQSNIFAQSKTITGKILDSETKEPIVGATIQLLSDFQIVSTTNNEGKFNLFINSETDSVKISFIGYSPLVIEANSELVISLMPNVRQLQSYVVTANREAGLRTH